MPVEAAALPAPSVTALDPSPIIPVRAVPPVAEARHLARDAGAIAVSLCANLVVLAGLVHLAFPQAHPLPEPKAIDVELVPEPPQTKPASATSDKPAAAPGGEAKPPETASSAVPEVKPRPPASEPPRPPDVQVQAVAAGPTRPEPPATPPDAATMKPPQPSPTPPPIGTGTDAAPHLVEAPAAPEAAAVQSEKNQAANAEARPAKVERPTEAPPPAAPDVLTTANPEAEAVPHPASTTDAPAPAEAATPDEIRQAENTAKLAAALPFSQSVAPAVKRAPVSGDGQTDATTYRGAVYGAFRKADGIVAAAREKNLRGQAVVVFTIDDKGDLTQASIALTSGNPEVDQVALAIVRRSAPYPPPPPGGQRTFSPAIALGVDGQ